MLNSIVIIETNDYIVIHAEFEEGYEATFYDLYDIKKDNYPDLVMVEIFPESSDLIDNSNVRHLWFVKGVQMPNLKDMENETDYQIIKFNQI